MLNLKSRKSIYYAVGTVNGKRYRKSLNTPSKKIAEMMLIKLEHDIVTGVSKLENKSFSQCIDSYTQRNPNTSQTTEAYLERFSSEWGAMSVSEIDTEFVEEWLDVRLDEIQGATARREMNAFMPVLRHAKSRGWIQEVPSVQRPDDGEPRLRALNPSEYGKIFDTVATVSQGGGHAGAWHLAHIMVNTGARIGEIINLRWKDVFLEHEVHDPATGNITVEPYIILTTRKRKRGKKAVREIPLNARVTESFREIRNCFSVTPDAETFVIPWWRDQRTAGKQIKNMVNKAGVYEFTPHDLRRTFATRLLVKGTHPRTVADLLGHTTLAMVMRYMIPPDDLKRSAVELI